MYGGSNFSNFLKILTWLAGLGLVVLLAGVAYGIYWLTINLINFF